jgi:hypothetical protein
MPRFVLLYHDCPPDYERPSHWDLMLEAGETLRTWALERLPGTWREVRSQTAMKFPDCAPVAAADSAPARMLEDHRLEYLEFEGELSGERGAVIRIAAGTFATEGESEREWVIVPSAAGIDGKFMLVRSDSITEKWTLRCLPA